MSGKRPVVRPQLDLFVPFLSDIDLRDQMELMEWPFFSLSKNKLDFGHHAAWQMA